MYIGRAKIRELVNRIEWVTPRNLSILANGKLVQRDSCVYRAELNAMCKTVRRKPLRKIRNTHGDVVFAKPDTKLKVAKDFAFMHDVFLRDCICKFLHERNLEGLDVVTTRHDYADAKLGNYYFEFDNGHMNDDQLIDKIRKNYLGKGRFQVVFWMAHREIKSEFENRRLYKLFEIASKLLYDKPNRVVASTYSEFLENGKLFNFKGREVEV